MWVRRMRYLVEMSGSKVIVHGIKDFNLKETLECGQCFRWNEEDDGSYTGVAFDRVINVKLNDDTLTIDNTTLADFNDIWYDYFDLGRDYGKIKETLSQDEILRAAIKYGEGIRILRQDTWETLISFIISQNNRIPQIKKVIENLSRTFGHPIVYKNKTYYTFPKVQDIIMADEESLSNSKCGFRSKYIIDAALKVFNDEVNLFELQLYDTHEVRNMLMSIRGVGPKVADCVILYSIGRYEAFPTDVWIKRVVEFLYLKRKTNNADVQSFAKEKFGDLSGFAQQYLFNYAKDHVSKDIFRERKN
ncbi:DNA-3-methyladenine glycosylase 2 family protein [Thermoanaerobacterium thermosaccharolyticum]|nr:DNA-3-methyladenine glycosylase 2 family protein [Thermoanaerobacterium thermosaccharolyticum]MBE0227375.1 DNA-3-methyladenine glycosylase 2 family protein [Thermoanaerobacterium thermosaccharolyticum]